MLMSDICAGRRAAGGAAFPFLSPLVIRVGHTSFLPLVPLFSASNSVVYNMSGIWAAYNKALAAQPLLVKAMTSFTGFTVGDILAQKFISPEDDYDFMRTLRLGKWLVRVARPKQRRRRLVAWRRSGAPASL